MSTSQPQLWLLLIHSESVHTAPKYFGSLKALCFLKHYCFMLISFLLWFLKSNKKWHLCFPTGGSSKLSWNREAVWKILWMAKEKTQRQKKSESHASCVSPPAVEEQRAGGPCPAGSWPALCSLAPELSVPVLLMPPPPVPALPGVWAAPCLGLRGSGSPVHPLRPRHSPPWEAAGLTWGQPRWSPMEEYNFSQKWAHLEFRCAIMLGKHLIVT